MMYNEGEMGSMKYPISRAILLVCAGDMPITCGHVLSPLAKATGEPPISGRLPFCGET